MSTYPVHKLSDGHTIPGVAYGVGTVWYGRDKEGQADRELVETIKQAVSVGFRYLDGAEAYGNETSLGFAIQECGVAREQLFVTTKCGPGLADIDTSFDASLAKLGLDYVDLYLIHWPYDFPKPGYPTISEAWKKLEAIRELGRAKSIGVSNFRVRDLQQVLAIPDLRHKPVVNQIEYHTFVYETAEALLHFMKEHNIALQAFGPTSPITKLGNPDFSAALDEVIDNFARPVEPGQIMLKFAAQHGAIVITTSSKKARMQQILEAGALPALTASEIASLVQAAKPAPKRAFMEHMDDVETEY